jgi:glyoxylase-like metal-dependent hydrolase (beta-lactamase superfamily II)
METHITTKGSRVIRILSGRSNSYIVKSGLVNLLVDTGDKTSYNKLIKGLTSLNCFTLDYIVLTHSHFDHCANTALLVQRYGCKVILSKIESPMVSEGITPIPKGTLSVTKILSALGRKFESSFASYTPFTPDIEVEECYDLSIHGVNIKIIHTPGHSAGSLSILVDKEIALVGDAMFGVFPGSILPPFADDTKQLFKSWQKLLDSGCTSFLPGHGKRIERKLLNSQIKKQSYVKK